MTNIYRSSAKTHSFQDSSIEIDPGNDEEMEVEEVAGIPIGPSVASPNLTSPVNPLEEGNIFRSNFQHHHTVYGSESIERLSTINEMAVILEKKIAFLEHSKRFHPSEAIALSNQINELKGQLQGCHDALNGQSLISPKVKEIIAKNKNILEENTRSFEVMPWSSTIFRSIQWCLATIQYYTGICKFNWLGSNYFRDCLKDCPLIANPNLRVAYQAYLEAISKVIPAPINFRRQEVSTKNGNDLSFLRIGVISDMRNGYFSLSDLIKLQSEGREEALAAINKKCNALMKKHRKSTPELVVMHYAANQLKTEESLAQAIASRRSFLQHQMLSLVLEHLKTAKRNGSLDRTNILPIMSLSLLNPATDAVDETGWKKNESVFMSDMAQIFEEFDGKEILFDGHGPVIDGDGNIHLPQEYGVDRQQVTIYTFFANISVQGTHKKIAVQKEINRNFFEKIRNYFGKDNVPPDFLRLEQELQIKGKSNFPIAEQLAEVALKWKFFLSGGCLSAKDRTGFLCGRIGVNHILKHSREGVKQRKKRSRQEQIWSEQILSGPALQVCKDCNNSALTPQNVKALKLTSKLENVGAVERVNQYFQLASMTLNPDSPSAQKNKTKPPETKRLGMPNATQVKENNATFNRLLSEGNVSRKRQRHQNDEAASEVLPRNEMQISSTRFSSTPEPAINGHKRNRMERSSGRETRALIDFYEKRGPLRNLGAPPLLSKRERSS